MAPQEFTAILAAATPDQLETLEMAHWRYMSLIGIVDAIDQAITDADRLAWPAFVKQRDGLPLFVDSDCTAFMVAITRLPAEFCAAWMNKDYYELHGETAHETAERAGG